MKASATFRIGIAGIVLFITGTQPLAAAEPKSRPPELFVMIPKPLGKSSSKLGKTEKAVHHITFNSKSLDSPRIGFTSPSGGDEYLVRKSKETDTSGYSVWIGASEANPAETSTIVGRDGIFVGTIQVRGRTYSIAPLGEEGGHALI